MADQTPGEEPIDWKLLGFQIAAGGLAAANANPITKPAVAAAVETDGAVQALAWKLLVDTALAAGNGIRELEEPFLPLIAAFVAPILSGLFGAEFDPSEFHRRMGKGAGTRGAHAIVDGFMTAIIGDTPDEIQPSDVGAKRIASAAVQAALESEFNAKVPELLSHILPFDVGHFEGLSELPEEIIRTLGVSRLVRRALTPFVTTCCTTPATWYVNKQHRPTLLGASSIAKQIARHPDAKETWLEDLKRQGYSDARIEALLNEQAKFHSVTDVDLLIRSGQWSESQGLQHLRDQGYDDDVARVELLIEKIKRIAAFERQLAGYAIDAYAAGRITEGDLGTYVSGNTISDQEKAQLTEIAHARRLLGKTSLTPSEAAAGVESGVLAYIDYREALQRAGRDDEAVTALELMLRAKVDAKRTIEQHRADLDAERAAEKAARLAAAAAKKSAADARLALARRGSIADLERAFVRGLVPIERVREVYDATYDDDTVAILVENLEGERADYVARQTAAAAAAARALTRGVDVGQLNQAVLAGVLTLDQFRRRLTDLHFSDDDAELLASTLSATLQDRADAQTAHDAAVAAAKVKHIDLPTIELLVRRGHRTMGDFRSVLTSLGYDDGAQAALVERLQLEIDDDAAAAKVRADAAAKLAARGLSLDQFRRAVVLGLKPIAEFSAWLTTQGFTADAANTLVQELQVDVDEAGAARARRAAADRRTQTGVAPLSDVRRAARLGLIDPAVYYARLTADGYTDDDVAIESDLLTVEIAQDRAQAAAAAAAEAASHAKGLTLAQLEAAILVGEAPIADYTGRALQLGLTPDAADTLTRVLQDKLDAKNGALARAAQLAGENKPRELARADFVKAVKDDLKTMDEYNAWLLDAGYSDDDAALLVAELQIELDAAAAKAGGAGGG